MLTQDVFGCYLGAVLPLKFRLGNPSCSKVLMDRSFIFLPFYSPPLSPDGFSLPRTGR